MLSMCSCPDAERKYFPASWVVFFGRITKNCVCVYISVCMYLSLYIMKLIYKVPKNGSNYY